MGWKTLGRYRVIAVSLFEKEVAEADRITALLRRAGWAKANRSLVVREALTVLDAELQAAIGDAASHRRRVGGPFERLRATAGVEG